MAAFLLSQEFLHRLDTLRLASNQAARGHLKGLHRSNRAGSGIEFKDYRPYSEGDDLKSVDWRAYLRLDRLVVRLFVEEADLPIYIFIDTSASMDFGAPTKFDYGRKVAAALAHLGFINMDRVSLIAVANGVIKALGGLRGKEQSWPAFRFLEALKPGGRTALEVAFKRYFGAPRAKGLVIVISDFLDAGFEGALKVLRDLRQDVLAVHVLSPEELAPQIEGEVVLVDAEDGGVTERVLTAAHLATYQQALEAHCSALKAYCDRNGWVYLRATTDTDFEGLVLQALRVEGLIR